MPEFEADATTGAVTGTLPSPLVEGVNTFKARQQINGTWEDYGDPFAVAYLPWATETASGLLPALDLDFSAGRYFARAALATATPTDAVPASVTDIAGATYTRAGAATALNADGTVTAFAEDVPRITDRGFCAEPARTNYIASNDGSGSTAGVLGAGGALPTGWTISGIATSNVEVLGTDALDGMDYLRLKLSGTPTGNITITMAGAASGAPIVDGQKSVLSAWLGIEAGSLTNFSGQPILRHTYYSGGGVHSLAGAFAPITGTRQRFVSVDTAQDSDGSGSIDEVTARLVLSWTSGIVDLTLLIGLPQLEVGDFVTSPIPTSGTAAARGVDLLDFDTPAAVGLEEGCTILAIADVTNWSAAPSFTRMFEVGGAANSRVYLTNSVSTPGELVVVAEDAAHATVVNINPYGAVSGIIRAALRLKSNDVALQVDDGNLEKDTVSDLTAGDWAGLTVGNRSAGDRPLLGYISRFVVIPPGATDADVSALAEGA